MNLPNELTLNILSSLRKKDIKEARLVCKLWDSLAVKPLFDTIYVSPREIDMCVFEAITEHPVLRSFPRHLVYDSAQFEKLDEVEYAMDYAYEYGEGGFNAIGDSLHAVQEVIRNMPDNISEGSMHDLDPQLRTHPLFEAGFRVYTKHANEYANVFTKEWSRRVYRGLKNLGPIVSVSIRNTWDMIYDEPRDDFSIQSNYETHFATLVSRGCIEPDGTRLVGSPSARAYPFTALPPVLAEDWTDIDTTEMMETSRSSTKSGFLGILNLMSMAGKRPEVLNALGGLGADLGRTGISTHIFDPTQTPDSTKFLGLAGHLRYLQLNVIQTNEDPLSTRPGLYVNIKPLQQFLRQAHSLEVLSLSLPEDLPGTNLSTSQAPFNCCPIFSDSQAWLPPGLKELEIQGFSATCQELSTHLCLCLPNLTRLFLGQCLLSQGCYEDLITALRQHASLEACVFNNHLYNADGKRFLAPHSTGQETKKQEDFSVAISCFIVTGEKLPDLGCVQRDTQFNDWLRQMKAQQRQLIAAYVGEEDTSGRLRQSFPRSDQFTAFVEQVVGSYKNAPSIYRNA
ncbi:MAG: hypothetical protein Q9168_006116 [Polycauliona sp. 1 TL-2023]